jgi:hypothetical protein
MHQIDFDLQKIIPDPKESFCQTQQIPVIAIQSPHLAARKLIYFPKVGYMHFDL